MHSTGFSGIVKRKSDMASALMLALLFLFPAPLMSAVDEEVAEPELKSVFSPSVVTIGDRVAYTVTVTHPPSQTVSFALPDSTELMPFVLIQREAKRPRKGVTVFEAEFALFDIGKYALPVVSVTFRDTLGDEKRIQHTALRNVITVEALTGSSTTELLPIKPLKQPHRPWIVYLLFTLFPFAILAAVFLVRFFMRRRAESPQKPVDYTREALRKVRKLEKNLGKGMRPEECYEQLSYLIRQYLEEQYGIKALEEVTNEIEEELSSCSVPHDDILVELLNQADLVKFAESKPGREECCLSLDQAKEAIISS